MKLTQAVVAFALLLSFSIFIFINTRITESAGGYLFLLSCGGAFLFLLFLTGNVSNIILLRSSTLIVIFFFIYFSVKHYVEIGNSFMLTEQTIGTTGGMVFGFVLGVMLSQALSLVYDLRIDPRAPSSPLAIATFLYILLLLGMAALTFLTHQGGGLSQGSGGELSGGIFLVEEGVGYQRVGDLLIMQYIVVCALAAIIGVTSTSRNWVNVVMLGIPLTVLCGVVALTAQLVGSNKGFVVPVGMLLVFFAVVMTTKSLNARQRRTSILNILLSSMVLKLTVGALVGLAVIALFGASLMESVGISSDALRITGFGSGELGSLDSRNELFSDNFVTHFQFSPFFGNTQVEMLTTGQGTYVHSILSVITHLGIFGGLVFLALMASIYFEISGSYISKFQSMFSNQGYGLFRFLSLLAVFVMGAFSAFYTWMPWWFAVGLFGNWYHQRRWGKQHNGRKRKKRRRRRVDPVLQGASVE
jgi:hypothetical protein